MAACRYDAIERGVAVDAEQGQADPDLVLEELQHAHQAGARRGGERPCTARRPRPTQSAPRAIAFTMSVPRTKLPSTITVARPAHRLDDLGQDVQRAAPVVELAAAVVGHVDDLDAVRARELGVLGGGDALQDQRDVRVRVLEALDVVPGQRGLEVLPVARTRHGLTKRRARSRSRRL